MSVTITVRAVPDDTRDELAAPAASRGMSLQEYLRAELVTLASRPSAREAVDRARARARSYSPVEMSDLISDLDAERR
jgi:hypothetical protein